MASLVPAGDRWVVLAQIGSEGAVATLTKRGRVAVLDRGAFGRLAVDPSGRYVAWGSGSSDASPKYGLTEYDLATDSVVARRTVAQPASVEGWAERRRDRELRIDHW